jgi:ribosomal protein L5
MRNEFHNKTIERYLLQMPIEKQPNYLLAYHQAYLNHMQFWHKIKKVTIHSTSKKYILKRKLYGPLNAALSCITVQTPCLIRSKKSIASFQVMKDDWIGCQSQLGKQKRRDFNYKWTFLSASLELISQRSVSAGFGIENLMIFELEEWRYAAFEDLSGLDVIFG